MSWKGWAYGDTALYLDQVAGADNVHLFLQYGEERHLVALFADINAAEAVQDWLEQSLSAVGQANAALAAQLQEHQRG